MKKILLSFFIGVMLIACNQKTVFVREVWTKEQANEWYKQWGWLRGCDFIPSTAINQMEMWQADTFDPVTIDRELGWAEDIGMNCMRVYLHHLVWETDKEGFKKRINEYLTIADKHHISTIFVFLDDCWNPTYQAGKQPEPQPGVHNSGWARDIEVDCSFLGDKTYDATLFNDGVNAHRVGRDYKCESFRIKNDSKLKIHLAPGGGFALKIK